MARNSLHVAAKRGDVTALHQLLDSHPNLSRAINEYDHHGYTPLMYAVIERQSPADAVTLLISNGASAHQIQKGMFEDDMSVMSLALRHGDPTKVRLLIEAQAPLNYCRRGGYGPLLDAMFGRDIARNSQLIELLKLLICNNANLDAVTEHQESALRVLSNYGRFDGIELLLGAGADESQLEWTALMKAVALGTADEVKKVISLDADLEARDWWKRSAFLIAIQTGDIEKTAMLLDAGANASAVGHCGKPALFYAIETFQTEMMQWLIETGADPLRPDQFGHTSLLNAVECDNVAAVEVLLRKGVPLSYELPIGLPSLLNNEPLFANFKPLIDAVPELAELLDGNQDFFMSSLAKLPDVAGNESRIEHAVSSVCSKPVAQLLLSAGADPKHMNHEAQRVLLGLSKEPDDFYLNCSRDAFIAARTRTFGTTNPERMDQPFWLAMIRAGVNAYQATQYFDGRSSFENSPVWCAQRFGQSITFLSDGRIVQIGGEHEDHYDPDFCIYNDVFVCAPDGSVEIYGYPEAVFPPTDFHSATLVDEGILVIGGLGYFGSRVQGETRVFLLDLNTYAFNQVDTFGDAPGWIYGHSAQSLSPTEISITGGEIVNGTADDEKHCKNAKSYVFDIRRSTWSCV